MKIDRLFFIIILLLTASCTKENIESKLDIDFDVYCRSEFQNTVYPSLIFGLNEKEKQTGIPFDYFTINVNTRTNEMLNLRVVVQESKVSYETVIPLKNIISQTSLIASLKWKYDDMKYFNQPGYFDLTFICFDDKNNEVGRKDLKMSYASINECVFGAVLNNSFVDFSYIFAAYVNEDSPVIDAFLKEVLAYNPGLTGFTGYLSGNSNDVHPQVSTIFATLRRKGVKYSNITTTSNTNQLVWKQYVRFSDEVLNNTQANCMDGTAFFCSCLRKIGIHSVMVFKPGHVYLGYYSDANRSQLHFLETTLIGTNATIWDAWSWNVNDFNTHLYLYNNADVSDQYFMIDIDAARNLIKPIGR